MKIDDNYKNELIKKYRTELFETDDIDLNELDSLISDDDLKAMYSLNNNEMGKLINIKDVDKEKIKKLLVANINLYKLAKMRDINMIGSSFLMNIASVVGYSVDKLYDEINMGRYYRPHRPR